MSLRLTIDSALCARTRYCIKVHPDLFTVGPDGSTAALVEELDGNNPWQVESARDAEALCPVGAIFVE
jgi:ferredoxin